jgi:hypothetical protein
VGKVTASGSRQAAPGCRRRRSRASFKLSASGTRSRPRGHLLSPQLGCSAFLGARPATRGKLASVDDRFGPLDHLAAHDRVGDQTIAPLSAQRAIGFAHERSPAETLTLLFPAAVVSEPELSGHIIRRVYEQGSLVGVRLLEPGPSSRILGAPAGAGHTDSYLQYISGSPRIAQDWVSVSAASIVVAFSRAVRLGELRSRACKCSRGHRPSGCDTEARGRRATLPQRHRSGVGGSLIRTPLRRAYRLQRPCSLPIVRAYFGSA